MFEQQQLVCSFEQRTPYKENVGRVLEELLFLRWIRPISWIANSASAQRTAVLHCPYTLHRKPMDPIQRNIYHIRKMFIDNTRTAPEFLAASLNKHSHDFLFCFAQYKHMLIMLPSYNHWWRKSFFQLYVNAAFLNADFSIRQQFQLCCHADVW